MIIRPRTALVTCLLLFILMEDANPIPVVKIGNQGLLKKLAARVKKSADFGLEEECKLYSLIKILEARVTEIEKEIAELKNPQTTAPPATTTSPPTTTLALTTTLAPATPTEGSCTAIGVAEDIYNIPDDQMTATSIYRQYYSYQGRLNGESGWCAGSKDLIDDYLQVDMGAEYSVCAVATQGKSTGSWVTSYTLSFSTDGVTWSTYQEEGEDKDFQANEDRTTTVEHSLDTYAQARYARFYPTGYSTWPCMRVEIFVS